MSRNKKTREGDYSGLALLTESEHGQIATIEGTTNVINTKFGLLDQINESAEDINFIEEPTVTDKTLKVKQENDR